MFYKKIIYQIVNVSFPKHDFVVQRKIAFFRGGGYKEIKNCCGTCCKQHTVEFWMNKKYLYVLFIFFKPIDKVC